MNSGEKPESDITIRLLRRDEFPVVAENSLALGWQNTLDRMYMMYDALSTEGYKTFGAVDKNDNILSKFKLQFFYLN